jgi:ectoine hydroxylase-related dioxygenase (phytanoyl-CoA dioxygenase family)
MNKIEDSYYSKHFLENGYVHIPSVIKPELIKSIRETFTIPIANHVLKNVPNRLKISADRLLLSEVPELIEMIVENLKDVFMACTRQDSLYLMYEMMFIIPGHSPYHTIVHQDIGANMETIEERFPRMSPRHPDTISVWIPFVDVDKKSSCMYVIPYGTNMPKYIEMKAGDVLFLSYFIPHGSTVNSLDTHRETLLMAISPQPTTGQVSDINLPLVENGKVLKADKNKIKQLLDKSINYSPGEDDYMNI